MVGQIYWRWHSVNEPATVAIVGGDGSLEGAKIGIAGKNFRYSAVLDGENGWQSSILLDPGTYHLTVTHRNLTLRDENFSVDRTRGMRFELPSMVVIVGNYQLADSRIEILSDANRDNSFVRAEIKLEAKDRYREPIYLFPGAYRAVARSALNPALVLAKADFTVDRTTPVRVDLVKALNEGGAP
jgi:hypothetical protein